MNHLALAIGYAIIGVICFFLLIIIGYILNQAAIATISTFADIIKTIRRKIPRHEWKATFWQVWSSRFLEEKWRDVWKEVKNAYYLPVVVKHNYRARPKVQEDNKEE